MTSPDTAAFKTNKKLPARYGALLTPLVISVLMSCIVSGVSIVESLGFVERFLAAWMSAWMASWLVAFPMLLVVLPVVRRIVATLVQPASN